MSLRMRRVLRWGVWLLLALALGGLESSPAFPSLYGTRPNFLLAAAVSGAVLEENQIFACGYGMFCGFIWDVAEGKLFGFYALIILMICAGVIWLIENFLRVGWLNAVWLSGAGCIICGLIADEFYLFIWGYADGAEALVIARTLARGGYTAVISPIVFFFLRTAKSRAAGVRAGKDEICR